MVDLLSTATSPWANPAAWDTIQIGTLSWFGKFEIRGADRKYRWNIADGWGFAGAYEIFQSQPPAKFSITFYIWADAQYSTYLSLVGALSYSPAHLPPNNATGTGKNTNALQIVHPQLQANGITQVIVESIGSLEKQSDDLLFSFRVDLVEFVPQRPFPPQVPDTAANANDPGLTAEQRDAGAQFLATQQQLSNNLKALGIGGSLP